MKHIDACLPYIYVANDIVQKAKRENSDLDKKFMKVLPSVFEKISDRVIQDKIRRVLVIWTERGIYPSAFTANLKNKLDKKKILNPLFAEEEDADEEDPDHDEDSDGGLSENPGIERQDSFSSFKNEIPLPRLVSLAKRADNKSLQLVNQYSLPFTNMLARFDAFGDGFQKYLDSLSNAEATALETDIRNYLRLSRDVSEALESSHSLESSLISSMEQQLDSLDQKKSDYFEYIEKCKDFEKRLNSLRAQHNTDDIEIVVVKTDIQKILLAPVLSSKRSRSDSSGSSDYEEDDFEEDEIQTTNDNSVLDTIGQKLQRKKKKKKEAKKADEELEDKVQMVYNKLTKEYVPLDESESWRDH